MREIKFRIFDGKAMSPCVDLRTMIESFAMVNRKLPEDVLVMQYTGLHDKNGRDIYEGDIVTSPLLTRPMEVVIGKYHVNPFQNDGGYHDESEQFEVIGNIHENPEILEK